jgi:hypothetical protein
MLTIFSSDLITTTHEHCNDRLAYGLPLAPRYCEAFELQHVQVQTIAAARC